MAGLLGSGVIKDIFTGAGPGNNISHCPLSLVAQFYEKQSEPTGGVCTF